MATCGRTSATFERVGVAGRRYLRAEPVSAARLRLIDTAPKYSSDSQEEQRRPEEVATS